MAKKQDILYLDEFKDWLDVKDFANQRSRDSIISRLTKLNKRHLISISTGDFMKDKKKGIFVERTIWDVLGKILNDSKGPKSVYARELLVAIISNINKEKEVIASDYNISIGTVYNYNSAFGTYRDFIEYKLKELGAREKAKLTPNENATIKNISGDIIILYSKQLISIFASRMNTQDRCSGNKVFLPLALIGKILKRCRGLNRLSPKNAKFNLSQWAKKEAEKVIIYTETGYYPVTKISQIKIDTNTGEVYIKVDDVEYRAYNPLENKATIKQPIYIQRISQTDIDHKKEIDTILKENGGSLKGLTVLTAWIKKAQDELNLDHIDSENLDSIYDHIFTWDDIDSLITDELITDIIHDLGIISREHELQLSTSNWNRSTKKQAKKK